MPANAAPRRGSSRLSVLLGAGASLLALVAARAPAPAPGPVNPVTKVVRLLQEMKVQVEKEADDDQQAYDKYECWCQGNRAKKTEAVAVAEKRIDALTSFLEGAAGLQAQLQTEIETLEKDVAEDQEALSTATELRMKESDEFHATEKDAMGTIGALQEAVAILGKVQLLQRTKGRAAVQAEVKPLLLQVRAAVEGVNGKLSQFKGVMQRDLWDVLSSIDDLAGGNGDSAAASGDFLAGRRVSALEQRGLLRAGQAPLVGAAAGASSYSARSGGIYGMLSEMKDEFERDLAADQKEDMQALISYQSLRATKLSEIALAQASHESKQAELADSTAKAAQAREDLETTREALSADQQFLVGLEQNCKENVDGHEARAKARSEELMALAEAITILTEDDARDLFVKMTPSAASFLQTGASSISAGGAGAETDAARNKAVEKAMKHILQVARKQHNWVLASLAVRMRLDPFTRVHEAIDKMTAELKAQQKAEYQKKDYCNSEIDEHEDGIKQKTQEKADLEGLALGLENQIAALGADIETAHAEVADMQTSLKQAGEDRKAGNLVFQQAVSDQRSTQNILEKAKARLAKFYAGKSLVQAKQAPTTPGAEPGAAVEAPPPMAKDYAKSAGAGGVLQLLDMIIADAAREEAELMTTESAAQSSYETVVKDLAASLQATENAILDKTKLLEEATAEKSEHEGALLVTGEQLAKLGDTLTATHLDCDFLIQHFDTRQKAREEELSAIADAKAILSGADFGKPAATTEASE